MITASARFATAVRQGHTVAFKAELWSAGVFVRKFDITSGSVTADSRRLIRRTCDVTIVDADGTLTPADAKGLFAPFGNEIALYRGITFPDLTTEWILLGFFMIGDTDITHGPDGVRISISAADRSRRVQRASFTSSWLFNIGDDVGLAAKNLTLDRWSDATVNIFSTGIAITATVSVDAGPDADPLGAVCDMAKNFGYEYFVTNAGAFVLNPIPVYDSNSTPALTYAYDSNNMVIDIERAMSDADTYSGVVVIGQTVSADPVRVELWDNNPNSPTYYLGAFGKKPKFIVTPHAGSQDYALLYAQTQLQKLSGVSEAITFNQIPDPRIEPNDLIQLVDPVLKLSALIAVDSVTIPLDTSGTMQVIARARTVWGS